MEAFGEVKTALAVVEESVLLKDLVGQVVVGAVVFEVPLELQRKKLAERAVDRLDSRLAPESTLGAAKRARLDSAKRVLAGPARGVLLAVGEDWVLVVGVGL